jgi:hypothetical protein
VKPSPHHTRTERLEDLVLAGIVVFVGLAAGSASFTHVHDWTMKHSPDGTPGWFGWSNAIISELVPVAALLTIRRRKRAGVSIGYPMFLLLAFAGFSLAAQLAVADPGASGWLLSALPAIAFMALVKLILTPVTATRHLDPATPAASAPVVEDTAPATPSTPAPVPSTAPTPLAPVQILPPPWPATPNGRGR